MATMNMYINESTGVLCLETVNDSGYKTVQAIRREEIDSVNASGNDYVTFGMKSGNHIGISLTKYNVDMNHVLYQLGLTLPVGDDLRYDIFS